MVATWTVVRRHTASLSKRMATARCGSSRLMPLDRVPLLAYPMVEGRRSFASCAAVCELIGRDRDRRSDAASSSWTRLARELYALVRQPAPTGYAPGHDQGAVPKSRSNTAVNCGLPPS